MKNIVKRNLINNHIGEREQNVSTTTKKENKNVCITRKSS